MPKPAKPAATPKIAADKPKVMTEKALSTALSVSEQINLSAKQLLRLYNDDNLFETVALPTITGVQKRVAERLTEHLVLAYSSGFDPLSGSSEAHKGMEILQELRKNQRDVVKGMKLTQCIVAENGPDSMPEALVSAAQELRSLGHPVTLSKI